MASASQTSNVVVWLWEDRPNLWIPYEADACHYLEKHFWKWKRGTSKKTSSTIHLGKCSLALICYEVDFVNMEQVKIDTGTHRKIKRKIYPSYSVPGCGLRWEWDNDIRWVAYDIRTSEYIEREYSAKSPVIDLSQTPLAIPNDLDFGNMKQINRHTHYARQVQRLTGQSYPLESHGLSVAGKSPSKGANATSTSNGYALPSQSKSLQTGVLEKVGKSLLSKGKKTESQQKKGKRVKVEHSGAAEACASDPLSEFCNDLQTAPDEDCAICFEKLCSISSYNDESEINGAAHSSSIKQLNQCKHAFHASCLQAMYNSGTKDGSLQCPTCKAIHGIKQGNQPRDGVMNVHHSHTSLPGHPDGGMITITYDFRGGVQGPEHPNPGKMYSARGFPRTCYLPDNKKGKKVLKLLKEAWRRRLVFTIGTSSTTGEQDTVVWNEIHHKTEAFSNHMGHGFPDPNYLDNVLAELAAQGVQGDDESDNQE